MIDTRGIFADRLLGAILGLPTINLLTSFLPSPKAVSGVFVIRKWTRAWPGNNSLETQGESSKSDYFPNRRARDKRYIPLQSQKG
jgi:hypothetical protein